jgi:hypothetical protein
MTSSRRIVRAIDLRDALIALGNERDHRGEWQNPDPRYNEVGYSRDILEELPGLAISYFSPNKMIPESPKPTMVKFGESHKFPNRVVVRYYCEHKEPDDVFDVEWDAVGNFVVVLYKSGAWERELLPTKETT